MNKRISLTILLVLILLLTSCNNEELTKEDIIEDEVKENEKTKEIEEIDKIEEMVNDMTMDEKIGQLMIFGLNGTSIDQHTIDMIEKNHIGGFILFKYNIEDENQTVELLNSLKTKNTSNSIPLFLSIDEEGGRVARLSDIFSKLPEAKKIGYINNKDISFEYGKILGMRIKSLGFNMNFAPVFDVNSNPENPVIGDRAFGSTVDIVADNGLEVMSGINSQNAISIIKHFPGHGDTLVDSHENIPVVNKDFDQLMDLELIPFIKGIEEDVDGIMVGHISYPDLDKKYPSTMSNSIINKLLREKLLYNGVVLSDDMTMGAIVEDYNIEDASIEFLKAGGDILLICHGYEKQIKVIDKVKGEVEKGSISMEELDGKVYRIIKLKQKYNIEDSIIDEIEIDSINNQTKELLNRIEDYK